MEDEQTGVGRRDLTGTGSREGSGVVNLNVMGQDVERGDWIRLKLPLFFSVTNVKSLF